MKIYTRTGDLGTTALRAGGRVTKDSPVIEANGTVDEAQALLGVARAETDPGGALDGLLIAVERDLWVLMAELATAPEERDRLEARVTAVTPEMVVVLEQRIDEVMGRLELTRGFAVPGGGRLSAALDHARTVVRRAERLVVGLQLGASQVPVYLNRLSDLCWALAREAESEHLLAGGSRAPRPGGPVQPRTGGPHDPDPDPHDPDPDPPTSTKEPTVPNHESSR